MQQNTATPRLTAALRSHFCRTGVPNKVWSDQGPQFSSKLFQDFAKRWGFKHTTSSPTYPQSNRKAEATVKSMKKLIQAAWTGRSINEDELCCSIGTHQQKEMASLLPKSSLDTQYNTPYLPTVQHLKSNGSVKVQRLSDKKQRLMKL